MDYRILFVDFNSYFASVEQQLQPHLRGKPVAVVPVVTNSTCAIAASYEAKAYGVKTGTNIGDARKMCPGLVCVPARHEAYVYFHQKIVKEVNRHLPILSVDSIDEMSCELYGRYREESGALEMAERIRQAIRDRVGEYLGCSIGISTNRFLAKVASDMKKPNGVTVIHPRDLPGRFEGMHLRDLPGIGQNMERRLAAKGLTSIEQLWHCEPKQALALWGGIEGERFWRALHGEVVERGETTRRMVTHSHVLGPEERPVQRAEQVGRRLLLKAASRMRRLGYRASHLDLSVRVEKGPRLADSVRFRPLSDSFGLLKVFGRLWKKVVGDKPWRLKKVSLALHGLEPMELGRQLWLFPGDEEVEGVSVLERERRENLSEVLDRITARFGRQSLTIGLTARDGGSFTGTKIAFTRIPEEADFEEWDKTVERYEHSQPTKHGYFDWAEDADRSEWIEYDPVEEPGDKAGDVMSDGESCSEVDCG